MSTSPASVPENRWPGERLGLPQTGPRSIARFGRRLAAVSIDWAIATVISLAFFSKHPWETNPLITTGLFAAEQIVFLLVVNGSVGHLLLGMRVVPVRPARLGLWRPIVRTVLLSLGVPALIWDRDQRGLHDKAAGTMLVKVR